MTMEWLKDRAMDITLGSILAFALLFVSMLSRMKNRRFRAKSEARRPRKAPPGSNCSEKQPKDRTLDPTFTENGTDRG